MKRKFEKLQKGDMAKYLQSWDTMEDARKFCRMVKKVAPNSAIHVRNVRDGVRVCVKTTFSADSWVMTFHTLLVQCKRLGVEAPDGIWNLASSARKHAVSGKKFHLENKDGQRVQCRDLISLICKRV